MSALAKKIATPQYLAVFNTNRLREQVEGWQTRNIPGWETKNRMQQGGASSDEQVAREPFDDPCQSIPVLPCCHGNNKEGRYQKHTGKRLAGADICRNHRQQSGRLCTPSACNISDEMWLAWVWSLHLHLFGQDDEMRGVVKGEYQKLHTSSITANRRCVFLTGEQIKLCSPHPTPYPTCSDADGLRKGQGIACRPWWFALQSGWCLWAGPSARAPKRLSLLLGGHDAIKETGGSVVRTGRQTRCQK